MKIRLIAISGLCIILTAMFFITSCGNKSDVQLDDTSNQVIPGEDWKGKYKTPDSTYVDIDALSDTDKSFAKETVFILELDVSGIAYLTLDQNLANKYARKADDYTKITTFDVKWTEEGKDSLILHAPDTNIKQMICTREKNSDNLRLEMQYQKSSEMVVLEPVDEE